MTLSELHGHENWKWYGFPGHFIVGHRCAFHLSTCVGGYLVSTVGEYLPDGNLGQRQTIGGGDIDFFETMVFHCNGEIGGNPNVESWEEIHCERYAESRDAEAGHYQLCWKYHELSEETE